MSEKILVVEDDLVLQDTLAYRLAAAGYEILLATNGHDAIETAQRQQPDLILLDVMLPGLPATAQQPAKPGIDGFEVCRVLRQDMTMPILMLTARTDEVDRVVGLEIGADDYITKPFSMRELLARIKAQLRRVRMLERDDGNELPPAAPEPLIFDTLVIDLNRCEVHLAGDLLQLKPKEYELLAALAQHRGQVLSRRQLLTSVWGWDHAGHSRTIDVHIRWLREKIEVDPSDPQRIVTVRGLGYRFDG
jgi:DNA-binding response OmpR family regulator